MLNYDAHNNMPILENVDMTGRKPITKDEILEMFRQKEAEMNERQSYRKDIVCDISPEASVELEEAKGNLKAFRGYEARKLALSTAVHAVNSNMPVLRIGDKPLLELAEDIFQFLTKQ